MARPETIPSINAALAQVRTYLEGHNARIVTAIEAISAVQDDLRSAETILGSATRETDPGRVIESSAASTPRTSDGADKGGRGRPRLPARSEAIVTTSPRPRADARDANARIFADIEALLRAKKAPLKTAEITEALNRSGHAVLPTEIYTLCQKRVTSGRLEKAGTGFRLP